MTEPAYIVVPNWSGPDGFQHYKDRDPIWIKNYTRLLSHDAYRSLTPTRRAILHGIWLEYARSGERLPTKILSGRLGIKVLPADLEALVEAGFVELRVAPEPTVSRPSTRPLVDHSPDLQSTIDETVSRPSTSRNEAGLKDDPASSVLALARSREAEAETEEPAPDPEPEVHYPGAGAGAADDEHDLERIDPRAELERIAGRPAPAANDGPPVAPTRAPDAGYPREYLEELEAWAHRTVDDAHAKVSRLRFKDVCGAGS